MCRKRLPRAKAAIDTFFWRVGDMLQAVLVFAGTQFAFTTTHYTRVNILLVAVWLVLIVCIYRRQELNRSL